MDRVLGFGLRGEGSNPSKRAIYSEFINKTIGLII